MATKSGAGIEILLYRTINGGAPPPHLGRAAQVTAASLGVNRRDPGDHARHAVCTIPSPDEERVMITNIERRIWRDRDSGHCSALELMGSRVIGCAGPILGDEVAVDHLDAISYERNPVLLRWVDQRSRRVANR
jgi:hypothetical protein